MTPRSGGPPGHCERARVRNAPEDVGRRQVRPCVCLDPRCRPQPPHRALAQAAAPSRLALSRNDGRYLRAWRVGQARRARGLRRGAAGARNVQSFGELLRHALGVTDALLAATIYPPDSWTSPYYPWRATGLQLERAGADGLLGPAAAGGGGVRRHPAHPGRRARWRVARTCRWRCSGSCSSWGSRACWARIRRPRRRWSWPPARRALAGRSDQLLRLGASQARALAGAGSLPVVAHPQGSRHQVMPSCVVTQIQLPCLSDVAPLQAACQFQHSPDAMTEFTVRQQDTCLSGYMADLVQPCPSIAGRFCRIEVRCPRVLRLKQAFLSPLCPVSDHEVCPNEQDNADEDQMRSRARACPC